MSVPTGRRRGAALPERDRRAALGAGRGSRRACPPWSADNGSTDGSAEFAVRAGARCRARGAAGLRRGVPRRTAGGGGADRGGDGRRRQSGSAAAAPGAGSDRRRPGRPDARSAHPGPAGVRSPGTCASPTGPWPAGSGAGPACGSRISGRCGRPGVRRCSDWPCRTAGRAIRPRPWSGRPTPAGGSARSGRLPRPPGSVQGHRHPARGVARRTRHERGDRPMNSSLRPDSAETVLVLAKEPVPGRVKTRLHARFSPHDAAGLAACAIEDTLDAVRASRAGRAWGTSSRSPAKRGIVGRPRPLPDEARSPGQSNSWQKRPSHRTASCLRRLTGQDEPRPGPSGPSPRSCGR